MKGLEILLNTDCFVLNFYSRLPDFTYICILVKVKERE
jgi:hypothetical protein